MPKNATDGAEKRFPLHRGPFYFDSQSVFLENDTDWYHSFEGILRKACPAAALVRTARAPWQISFATHGLRFAIDARSGQFMLNNDLRDSDDLYGWDDAELWICDRPPQFMLDVSSTQGRLLTSPSNTTSTRAIRRRRLLARRLAAVHETAKGLWGLMRGRFRRALESDHATLYGRPRSVFAEHRRLDWRDLHRFRQADRAADNCECFLGDECRHFPSALERDAPPARTPEELHAVYFIPTPHTPEQIALSRLAAMMSASPDATRAKAEIRVEFCLEFGFSQDTFDALWAEAIKRTGSNWGRPGRRRNQGEK